ncbi:MAG: sufC [Gammaproteobacteria bacterium]|jgi:Fe-S cluster assembly ATP-binding protein|nr:sufC [Gammaproteobacteria bacterium]
MIEIRGLEAAIGEKPILKGIDLTIKAGEIHAIMGPNGSGKSTLSKILAGHPDYTVTGGSIRYQGIDLLTLPADQRAQQGIFLAFQYPVEIPGVSNIYLLKAALNAKRRAQGLAEIDAFDFMQLIKAKLALVQMDEKFLHRAVNAGFSGGEKKRNEILQMALLEPTLAILDETDSGLDIDALKIVAQGVNSLHSKDNAILLITHYQRLLDYIIPDHVHILSNGKIIRSGDASLATLLETKGYAGIIQ